MDKVLFECHAICRIKKLQFKGTSYCLGGKAIGRMDKLYFERASYSLNGQVIQNNTIL